ncbi:hypothetical protein [Streptomyces wuyuanensis]|uniref:hypothetical protein n=1 Tax=Streptomyces wuyuanensis TaxID=1196353 RepID=UPI00341819FB
MPSNGDNDMLTYSVPDKVQVLAIPKDINWDFSAGLANSAYPIEEAWRAAGKVSWAMGGDSQNWDYLSRNQGWFISNSSACESQKHMSGPVMVKADGKLPSQAWACQHDTITTYIKGTSAERAVFVGKLTETAPLLTETDPVQGPVVSLSCTYSHTTTDTWSDTSGWSIGGKVTASVKVGDAKAGGEKSATGEGTFTYSKSHTDTHTVTETNSQTIGITPPAKDQVIWMAARRAGGNYRGWLLLHYDSASPVRRSFEALPAKEVYVKAPNITYPVTWHRREVNRTLFDLQAMKLYEEMVNLQGAVTADLNRTTSPKLTNLILEKEEAKRTLYDYLEPITMEHPQPLGTGNQ